MGFIPPLNLGNFQPSPATLSQWIYQIWQYLQENPIATQEQLDEYIATFITTSPETQALIGEGVEQYLTDNPPQAPVQSVQGKTGAVTLAFNDILKNNNTAPVYRAASMPSQSTLQAQYNLGYRLFVNTTTQEIYSITNTGSTTLVGKGKFDGTTVDLNSADGDTTIAEAITALDDRLDTYYKYDRLLDFSGYSQNSGVKQLSHPYSDYDFMIFRFGYDTSDGSAGGAQMSVFPRALVGLSDHISCIAVNGNGHLLNVVMTFPTTTTVKITACFDVTAGSNLPAEAALRAIEGVKFG